MSMRETLSNDPLLLAAYLDGALGEAETAEVEAWLAEDPAALDALLAARAALEEVPETAPEAVSARARAIVREAGRIERRGGAGFFGMLRPLALSGSLAAACLAVAVGGFQLGEITYQAANDFGSVTSETLLPGLAEGPFGDISDEG